MIGANEAISAEGNELEALVEETGEINTEVRAKPQSKRGHPSTVEAQRTGAVL